MTASPGEVCRDIDLCRDALGPELSAYVAGAPTVADFDQRVRAFGLNADMLNRLRTAASIIRGFAADNQLSMAAVWFREVPQRGAVSPARVIREASPDNLPEKRLSAAAVAWTSGTR
jgi:hypothetical protein